MRHMRQATAWPKTRNARSWYGTLMGHMRHSTGRADRQDKRAFELNRKGLTKGSKGSSSGTRAMAHKWFIWLIGIRDSIPLPRPIIINSRRS
jgi:hypothetical protein